jgi:hypothetical protein
MPTINVTERNLYPLLQSPSVIEGIKSRHPLVQYLERSGINVPISPGAALIKCPIHRERNGAAFAVYRDNKWRCFGKCSRAGDVIDLDVLLHGGDPDNAKDQTLARERLSEVVPVPEKMYPTSSPASRPPLFPLSADECRDFFDGCGLRLAKDNDFKREWTKARPEHSAKALQELALDGDLGLTCDGSLAFLYTYGVLVRCQLPDGKRYFYWAAGKPGGLSGGNH